MSDKIKDPVISRSGRIYSAAGLLALAAVLARIPGKQGRGAATDWRVKSFGRTM